MYCFRVTIFICSVPSIEETPQDKKADFDQFFAELRGGGVAFVRELLTFGFEHQPRPSVPRPKPPY